MEIKCETCGYDEFLVVKELDVQEGVCYEIWECMECGSLYKVYYRIEKIVRLVEEGDKNE